MVKTDNERGSVTLFRDEGYETPSDGENRDKENNVA